MTSASLALLKGGKQQIEKELDAPAPPKVEPGPEVVAEDAEGAETVHLDPDTMTEEEIEALLKEHEIDPPPGWAEYVLDQKRTWLNETFGVDEGDAEPTGEEIVQALDEAIAADAAPAETPATKKTSKKDPGPNPATSTATDLVPAKPPKKSTKKTAAPAEIVEADVIIDVVSEIEHLGRDDALKLVHQLTEETEVTFFRLGGALSVIMRNEWFRPDYPTFRDYVEQVYGMAYRRAAYWVAIYNALSESGIPWSKVKDVGWTKLKEIAQVLTQENVDEWVERAASMNTQNLIAAVKAAQADGAPKNLEDANAKATVTKSFKLHTDQVATLDAAIAKAKEQGSTTVDAVALQYICEDFVGTMTVEDRLKKLGLEKVIALVEKVFPEASLTLDIAEA